MRTPTVVLAAIAALFACERGGDAEPTDPKVEAAVPADAPAKPQPSEAAAAAPPSPATDLDAALARSIVPPSGDDATYRVDPFVAALLFEHLRAHAGAPTFTALATPKQGGPGAGWVVGDVPEGSVFARLGLHKGDVIEALNGVVLANPDRIGFALDGAQNRVDLTIWRDDYSFVASYRLIGALAWTDVLAGFDGAAPPDDTAVDGGAAGDDGATEPAAGEDGPDVVAGGPKPKPGGDLPPLEPKYTPGFEPGAPGKVPGGSKGTPPPSKPSAGGGTSGVACESTSKCTITRTMFDSMTSSPSKIESQATIVPAIANDVFSGYKLKWVKPGSAVHQLGFRAGDKITHVNGRDLTDDFQATQLYFSLSSTKVFKVRFERGGSSMVKTVVVV
jgi:membrane-associated protease RseP (regulator of RpoE activity)